MTFESRVKVTFIQILLYDTIRNLNSSSIFITEGVHIWENDCLTTLVSDHGYAIGVKRQCQINLQPVYGLLHKLLFHFFILSTTIAYGV